MSDFVGGYFVGFTRKSLSTRLTEAGVDYGCECKDRNDGLGLRLVYIIRDQVMTPGEAEEWFAGHHTEGE